MSDGMTVALVGATGGAGTTRLTVETAAALAVDGRDVGVFDAAFATQGLSDYLEGRLDPDLTALLTDESDAPLSAGLVDVAVDADGRVACCATHAPFERLARAKTAEAARRLEERVEAAARAFDVVLVDTPPVAANQSVAAATACDRVGVVAPASGRGADAVERMRARLSDLDVRPDATLSTRGSLSAADVAIPETDPAAAAAPTVATDAEFARAVAEAAATLVGEDVAAEGERGLLESVGEYVSR